MLGNSNVGSDEERNDVGSSCCVGTGCWLYVVNGKRSDEVAEKHCCASVEKHDRPAANSPLWCGTGTIWLFSISSPINFLSEGSSKVNLELESTELVDVRVADIVSEGSTEMTEARRLFAARSSESSEQLLVGVAPGLEMLAEPDVGGPLGDIGSSVVKVEVELKLWYDVESG